MELKTKRKYFVVFILFSICFAQPAYAYIDPGTGSMLFSVVLGFVASLYYIIQTLFLKIKFACHGNIRNIACKNTPILIYSEGNQYWNVFKPIVEELESKQINAVFYTSAQNDAFFEQKYEFVKGEYIGSKNKAYWKLAFANADVCLMTTPNLDVLQLKRSKNVKHYVHILHSIGDVIGYRLFALDYYDSILLNGEFQIENIRKLEKIRNLKEKELKITGCSYLDELKNQVAQLPPPNKNKFTVLVAPSWGENSILSRFGEEFLDNLISNTDWNIIIRPHPHSTIVEKDILERLHEKYKNNVNVSWDYSADNLLSMQTSDVLISDFSGIIFDYCFLFNKPLFYVNQKYNPNICDAGDLDILPYEFSILNKIGTEITQDNFSNVSTLIQNSIKNTTSEETQDALKDIFWQNRGKCAESTVKFLLEKKNEVCAC